MNIITKDKRRMLPVVAFLTVIMQTVLVLFSWIINTVEPSLPVRSLLSGEGVRWLFGGFTACVANPLLVWLLVCAIAWGVSIRSLMWKSLKSIATHRPVAYRHRHALMISFLMLLFIIATIIFLAFIPHAELLGVSGNLYPSSFSKGFIPMLALIVVVVTVVFGLASGTFKNLSDIYAALCYGIRRSAPLLLLYILAAQLYGSVKFVFF